MELHAFFNFLASTVSAGATIIVVLIVAAVFLTGLKMILGRGTERDAAAQAASAQELHRSLAAMERRLEALETLLLERGRQRNEGAEERRP